MQERPRLLVLTSTYPRWAGDPEPAFVHELSRRLTNRFEVHVLGPHAPNAKFGEVLDGVHVHRYRYAPERWETLVNDGGMLANVRRHPWKWLLVPGFLIGQYLSLRRLLRKVRPQVIHAHWLLPQGVVAACGARGVPWLGTSHGADLFALGGPLFLTLRRWVVRRAAATTLVSEAMRERLLAETPTASALVMPMGVDTSTRFIPGGDRENSELLFVGRLVEKKGLHHLLHALPKVIERHAGLVLKIIGFGPEQRRLETLVADLHLKENVRFLGALPQSALAEHYRRATVFIAPFVQAHSGDQEGLGLVVAEAMACGCPVIVGDVPAVRDLVGDDQGVRVTPADHAAFAEAILAVLANPDRRAAMSASGRRYVEQRFSWEVVSQRYGDLLCELADHSR